MEDNKINTEKLKWGKTAWKLFSQIRLQSPLIQCITNFVSMDLMANTLLSAGASPAMVHSIEEIPDFTPRVSALCVNVGTLSPSSLPAMISAAKICSQLNIPWVLDPVAVSASSFRFDACVQLVLLKPTVIRGNASEIIALASSSSSTSLETSAAKVIVKSNFFISYVTGQLSLFCRIELGLLSQF
jgi:hydroxyethylthiazole kinase